MLSVDDSDAEGAESCDTHCGLGAILCASMTHSDWLLLGILLFQTVSQIALRGDKWVHQQTRDGNDNGTRIEALERRLQLASDRSSEKESRLTEHLGKIDLSILELQTIVRLRGMDRS